LVVRIALRYSVAAVIGVATVAALMAKALSRRE
jgi:hypothetical protein